MFMTPVNINPQDIKVLSFYLMLKLRYKNSCIYNWTYKKISSNLKTSDYLTNKLVKEMLSKGLAYKHANNLCLTSFRNIKSKDKSAIKDTGITYDDTLSNVMFKLKVMLFRFYIMDRQNYLKKAKVDLVSSKRLRKSNIDLEKPVFEGICFGYRKLSRIIGCSLMSVKPFLDEMVRFGIIKSYEQRLLPTKISPKIIIESWKFKFPLDRFYVFKDNRIYSHMGTVISC